MKHSVALILPYYGTLPNYFPLWLKSAGANPDFTFMIFTDIDFSGHKIPENVQVHHLTFDGLKKLIAPHLDFDFILDRPYKLCDYRPMYGLIFRDYLSGYDFWGHVDPDIIWGNIGGFITDDLLDDCGRLGKRGPFCIYRNTEESRTFFRHKLNGYSISYCDVYSTKTYLYFDESKLLEELFSKFACNGGGGQEVLPVNANVVEFRKQLTLYGSAKTVAAFRWKDGKLFGLYPDGSKQEFFHVHLQKRAMNFTRGLEDEDGFLIFPTEFVHDHEITPEEITESIMPSQEYVAQWDKKYRKIRLIPRLMRRLGNFMSDNFTGKITTIKWLYDKKRHNGWLA